MKRLSFLAALALLFSPVPLRAASPIPVVAAAPIPVVAAAPIPVVAAAPIPVVAAENFYGDVARQIGGSAVKVVSILKNPDADPHLFEATLSAARAVAGARIVIENGLGYDPWMGRLLGATPGRNRNRTRTRITVAALLGRKPGRNPHIWYDPKTMPLFAKAFAAVLETIDPAHRAAYRRRLAAFERSMAAIERKVRALRQRLSGTPVTATEPVFGCMFEALGMRVRNRRFQLAIMNGTEPGASRVAAFETDLRMHRVRLLVYNRQASDPLARRMKKLAEASHIPVVGVTETEPPGESYQAWMASALAAVERALPQSESP